MVGMLLDGICFACVLQFMAGRCFASLTPAPYMYCGYGMAWHGMAWHGRELRGANPRRLNWFAQQKEGDPPAPPQTAIN